MMRGSLPRRYARALIELGKEENLVERFGEELDQLIQLTKKNTQMIEVLANDWVDFNERLAAMTQLSERIGFHPLLKNFLLLLVRKERIRLIPEITHEYGRYRDEILGIVRLQVATPSTPDKTLIEKIETILSKKLEKKVMAKGEAQPEMIGGLLLKLDYTVYDGSVRHELDRMKETLLKG